MKNYCLIFTCPASAKCWLSADRHLVFRPRDRFQRALVLLVLHGLALSREESKNARRLLLHCILQHEQNIHISENINLSKKSYFKKRPSKNKKTHLKTKTKMKNINTNEQAKHKKITKSKQTNKQNTKITRSKQTESKSKKKYKNNNNNNKTRKQNKNTKSKAKKTQKNNKKR